MADHSNRVYEYIIIGGGVFGVSTAFHLSRQSGSVLVLDEQYPGAASRDINKIVRFDYMDPFYMSLAREARSEWESNPMFKDHFHQAGRVVAFSDESQLLSIKENHKANGLSILQDLNPKDIAQKCDGLITPPIATDEPLDLCPC